MLTWVSYISIAGGSEFVGTKGTVSVFCTCAQVIFQYTNKVIVEISITSESEAYSIRMRW